MTEQITLITGNPGKAEQLGKYLNVPVTHHDLDLVEIQSMDIDEVVKHKVKEAYDILKKPVMVDDVSLEITTIGNLPGPFVKFFLKQLGNDGICNLVKNYENKSISATVALGYFDGTNLEIAKGEIKGTISDSPKGENGFGWDQIFVPEGFSKTRAEMDENDYNATNPRIFAVQKLEEYLNNLKV